MSPDITACPEADCPSLENNWIGEEREAIEVKE